MALVLTIGKLADAAGVNVETIRYYQRRGLLDEPLKPQGGHRRYTTDQVKRLRFIKRAQALGDNKPGCNTGRIFHPDRTVESHSHRPAVAPRAVSPVDFDAVFKSIHLCALV